MMPKLISLMMLNLLLICFDAYSQKKVYLSDLAIEHIRQDVFSPVKNLSMTGSSLKVGELRYDNGISMHAPALVYIKLDGRVQRLVAKIGLDDISNRAKIDAATKSIVKTDGSKVLYKSATSHENQLIGLASPSGMIKPGSAVLRIKGDGRLLWTSGLMKQGDRALNIDLDLNKVKLLELALGDGGDGASGDIVDLLEGMLIVDNGCLPVMTTVDEARQMNTVGNEMAASVSGRFSKLPEYKPDNSTTDWLLNHPKERATVSRKNARELVMSNGLVSRTLYLSSTAVTTSIKNLVTEEEYLRAARPEATVTIDGREYAVGGLTGQVNQAYLLPKWLGGMQAIESSFKLASFDISDLKQEQKWPSDKRWLPASQWQYGGKQVSFLYKHPVLKDIDIKVCYGIFNDAPLIVKWIEVLNHGAREVTLNNFESEVIAFHEPANSPEQPNETWTKPNFYLENSYAFGGEFTYEASLQSIFWQTDSSYTSQSDYTLRTPCVVKSKPPVGPAQVLKSGTPFKSFLTYFLALDNTDRERIGLAKRKMHRLLAPWATQNPIFMHLTSTDPEIVKTAVDQCADTGYEMVILSFGSGLNMEDTTASNIQKIKSLVDYAHAKSIEMGAYSLFSSRSISKNDDVINIKTGKPGGTRFGNAPCLASEWGIAYLEKIKTFIKRTGLDLLEHDGPYPGDYCASTTHPGHKGYEDSQWRQWQKSDSLYSVLCAQGVYINAPDFYFLAGATKTGIGYREVNWSLPREQQLLLGRQNIYDGTWTRTPSMCWTFVPLVEYQGGGKAATLEPLKDHLDFYKAHMDQNYGSGVQACYRGPRLYDSESTRKLVIDEIEFYKKHREILNADIIHLQRPSGRDWDGFMHADPKLTEKGFVMLFNPLDTPLSTKVKVPLYYTGIKGKALVKIGDKVQETVALDNADNVYITLTIPAGGNIKVLLEQAQ